LDILWGGVIVAVLCVGALLVLSWIQSQGAVATVQAQATAIRDGKLEEAYGLFSDDYRASTSLPMFQRWLRSQTALAAARSLRIWGRSVWGGTAILRGNFENDLGQRHAVRYSLVRENGNWRVDSLQVQSDVPEALPNTRHFNYI
jgi:hypothetical protein